MRLKVSLCKEGCSLPLAYQSILQGVIYALISDKSVSEKYHDEGYQFKNKTFKCFVFSQLFGDYTIKNKNIIFKDKFYFYISSQDELFLQEVYETLLHNEFIKLGKNVVQVTSVSIQEMNYFVGTKKMRIKTLSPMLLYSTKDNYSTYYKPSENIANSMIINNIVEKGKAYGYPLENPAFQIVNVNYEVKRMVKYKNCFYPAYLCEMEVETDYPTLLFMYNTGISSKGSCGFGMIEVMDEKSILLV